MRKALSFISVAAALVVAAPAAAAQLTRAEGPLERVGLDRPWSLSPARFLAVPYADPAGDATGGAGDITTTNVTNDPAGVLTFDVDVLNLPTIRPGDFYELLIDTDSNPASGDPSAFGSEILIQLDGSGPSFAVGRWNGSQYGDVAAPSIRVQWGSGPLISVNRADLGVMNAFNFVEDTVIVTSGTVTGVDIAPDSGTYSYTVTGIAPPPPPDTTAPNTRITRGPAALTRARSATFRFNSTEAGSTFQCKLDGGAWRACTSPKTYRRLKLGRHTFQVRARDAAGNRDGTPAKRSWRVRR